MNKKEEIEIRNVSLRMANPEQPESRLIQGTAIVFNQLSEVIMIDPITNMPIREIIDSKAITQDLLLQSDIKMLYNHNENEVVLARWNRGKGTLSINLTETGVDFTFEAKNNAQGQIILDAIRSGDIDKCSFAYYTPLSNFIVTRSNGVIIQRAMKITQLYDLSVVSTPAFEQTSVYTRALELEKETQAKEELQRLENEEKTKAERKAKIAKYYEQMAKVIGN